MRNFKTCGHHGSTRRHFLFGAASAALTVHADAEVTTRRPSLRNTARACIFVNLNGGASQMDTFDPKDGPWNPPDADIRDAGGGITLSRRFFPKLSTLTQEMLVIRSAASWEAAHERGQFYMQTAHSQNPALAAETPNIGSVIALEKGAGGIMPAFLAFNQPGIQGATFLGGPNAPMMPPATRTGVPTLTHNFFGNTSQQRFEQRFQLLQDLDAPLRAAPFNETVAAYSVFYGRAKALIYNDAVDSVFKFSADDENRYGANGLGRALLVSRNAVRAKNGAVFLSVTQGGWDTHVGQFDRAQGNHIYQLTNDLDRAVGALVEDLRNSGDLAKTLIVLMGEFGRTPGVLNSRLGRDHYRPVMSVALFGGGVRGGRVIGVTDATSANILDPQWSANRPIYPEDITATIYSALGIDWTKGLNDTPSGRRFYYINGAAEGKFQPVDEVW